MTVSETIEALTAALVAERTARQQAEARASSAEALIAYYKLQIARLRRAQYGPSSEHGRKLLDQLELQLEEAAASAAEDEAAATPIGSTTVHPFTRRKPVRAPFPAHLPRERVVIPGPAACRAAAAGSPSSARPSPRRWRWCRGNGKWSRPCGKSLPAARARKSPSHRHRSM